MFWRYIKGKQQDINKSLTEDDLSEDLAAERSKIEGRGSIITPQILNNLIVAQAFYVEGQLILKQDD